MRLCLVEEGAYLGAKNFTLVLYDVIKGTERLIGSFVATQQAECRHLFDMIRDQEKTGFLSFSPSFLTLQEALKLAEEWDNYELDTELYSRETAESRFDKRRDTVACDGR